MVEVDRCLAYGTDIDGGYMCRWYRLNIMPGTLLPAYQNERVPDLTNSQCAVLPGICKLTGASLKQGSD
jgi:hypothetical protein